MPKNGERWEGVDMITNEEKEQLYNLRSRGFSYKDISKITGRSFESIKKYCQSHGLGGKAKDGNPRLTEENIRERFNLKFPDFEYIGGYTNCESMITIKCRKCGSIIIRCASILRKNKILTCDRCVEISKEKRRYLRLVAREATKQIKEHKRGRRIQQIKIDKEKKEERLRNRVCKECGEKFNARNIRQIYCSDKCSSKHENRIREINRRHRLRENGKINWDISLDKLIKRDKNICHICGGKCSKKDYRVDNKGSFIAGNSYPSIDHLLPVSKGGTHTWDNVKLAHMYCNSIKNDNESFVNGEGQLTLSL